MQSFLFLAFSFRGSSFSSHPGVAAGMMMSMPYAIIVSSFLPKSEVALWESMLLAYLWISYWTILGWFHNLLCWLALYFSDKHPHWHLWPVVGK